MLKSGAMFSMCHSVFGLVTVGTGALQSAMCEDGTNCAAMRESV